MQTRQRVELASVSALTVVDYVLLYLVQRRLFVHGLGASSPFVWPRTNVDPQLVQGTLSAYLLLVGISCLLYSWMLVRVSRWRGAVMTAVFIAVPAVLHLFALSARPTLSMDAYSYLAHGYLAAHPPLNPYVQEASVVAVYPYGDTLRQLGWLPLHPQSPYGPLWTQLERFTVLMTGPDADMGQWLIRVPVLASTWGSALLIFALASRFVPHLRWTATVGWLWSPISLVELAGDGHIDAVMVFFVLLTFYAVVRGWGYLTIVALGLAVAVKYLPAVFAPPLVWTLWTQADSKRKLLTRIASGGLTVLTLLTLAFAPFWVGWQTFAGVRESGRLFSSWTPSGLLLTAVGANVADPQSEWITQALLLSVLGFVVLFVSMRVAGSCQLLRGGAVIACASFAILPGGWPWYAVLPIALVLCVPTLSAQVLVVVMTVSTRSIAAFGDLQTLGLVPYENTLDLDGLIGVTIPGLCCTILAAALWWREPQSIEAPTDAEVIAPVAARSTGIAQRYPMCTEHSGDDTGLPPLGP